jgi:hypothetical protein
VVTPGSGKPQSSKTTTETGQSAKADTHGAEEWPKSVVVDDKIK